MLQSIRDHTQGWIAGVIISLLILSFAMWGISSYVGGGGENTTVAKVNGVDITKGQLSVAYERLRRQLQAQYSSSYELPDGAELKLKDRALQALINVQVLKQASLSHHYRISSNQVDNYLENMPEFQVNGQFSIARLQKLLETTLFTPSDFLDLIKTNLLIEQPRLGVIFTSFALPNEINDSIALVNQERDIQYIVLPFELSLKQSIQIPNEKVETYYKQHQDDFKTPEQVSVEYVELGLKDLMTGFQPTDEALKNFYNENANVYAQPMQRKLDSILVPVSENAMPQEVADAQKKATQIFQQAMANKDFAVLRKEFSVEQEQKLNGWVILNHVPAELQNTVITLTKPGQVIGPVKTLGGFVILKADEIKDAVVQPYDQVKDKVKQALIHQLAEEKFAEMREKLSNIVYEHPETLEFVTKAINLPVKTSEVFAKDTAGKGITANSKVREAAFSNDVLNLRNNSDVILLGADSILVLRVKTHSPATLLPITAVEKQIIDKLRLDEIELKTQMNANEIKQKLESGSDQQFLQQYHVSWKSVGFIGRHSEKVDSAILDTAFEMSNPQKSKRSAKSAYAVAKVPNGYAVIVLNSVKDGLINNTNRQQYQVFAEQLQNTQGLMEYELYKQSQIQQAKIVLNN